MKPTQTKFFCRFDYYPTIVLVILSFNFDSILTIKFHLSFNLDPKKFPPLTSTNNSDYLGKTFYRKYI